MKMSNMHCGMMGNPDLPFCEPLQRLKKEHVPLTVQMDELHDLASMIGKESNSNDWQEQLLRLRERVLIFVSELDPHSEREEGFLFPMIGQYIGMTTGPIAVMEYEHEQAKNNLDQFLQQTEHLQGKVKQEEAEKIAGYVIQAYLILSEHFMKEENVLFPLAERMLSAEEKAELNLKINSL